MLKDYYALTKPGLVYGNIIPVVGGFALASGGSAASFDFVRLAAVIIGISFVMASGCVFNNVIDRDIDRTMAPTKNRAIVVGKISGRAAIIFGGTIGILGFLVLALFTNPLATAIAAFGWIAYVVLYSLWGKRSSIHGPLIGSISGAIPPVVGYCAISDRIDVGAVILFAILVLWQIPHFYAISIYRFDDYASADIPILPVKKGMLATKIQMFVYIIAFIIAALALTLFGYTGIFYTTIVLLLGLAWLVLCTSGFFIPSSTRGSGVSIPEKFWARKMFFLSLIVMVVLFATLALQRIRI